ncbi:MAG: hypothetical protein ABIR27_01915 [Dokdonella sp.]
MIEFRRRWTKPLLAMLPIALFFTASAQTGRATSSGVGRDSHSYTDIGKDGTFWFRCHDNDNILTWRCQGFPRDINLLRLKNDEPTRAATWISQVNFRAESNAYVDPTPPPGTPVQSLTIAATGSNKHLSLQDLDTLGYVMSRIRGNPNAIADERYGIGKQTNPKFAGMKFTNDWYMVISAYDASDVREANLSRKVSQWHIFGVDTSNGAPRLVMLDKTGTFRWCAGKHKQYADGDQGQFATCKTAAIAHELQADLPKHDPHTFGDLLAIADQMISSEKRSNLTYTPANIATAEREFARFLRPSALFILRQIAGSREFSLKLLEIKRDREVDSNTAWMTCGGGCCTGDNI